MEAGQGLQLAHGLPGTPVGDLFPLGNAVLGNGNRIVVVGTSYRAPNPEKLKSDPKVTFGGLPQSSSKVTPKVTF